MNKERKIIVYIATSADGYIARADGNVDWLNRPRTAGDYGMSEFYKSIDTVLWGRKTYEPMLQKFASKKRTAKRPAAKEAKPKSLPGKIKNYVFSHQRPENIPPGVEFVTSSIKEFAQNIRAEPGKSIWMMGG